MSHDKERERRKEKTREDKVVQITRNLMRECDP